MRGFMLAMAFALASTLPTLAEDAPADAALGLPEAVEMLSDACLASAGMKAMFDATEGDGTTARTEVCACLVEVLGPQITLEDADMLSRELSGTLTDELRSSYERTEQLGEIAEAGFETCQKQTNHFTTD